MKGSDWNKILGGLVAGGSMIGHSLIEKSRRDDLDREYKEAKQYLKNSFLTISQQQQAILDSINNGTRSPIEKVSSDQAAANEQDLFTNMLDRVQNLRSREGGDVKASALESLYSNYFPQKTYEDKTIGNDIVRRNPDGSYTRVFDGKKDEQPKDFTLNKDSKIMQYQDAQGNTKYGFFQPDPKSNDFGFEGWKFTGVGSNERDYNYQESLGEFAPDETGGSVRRRSSRRSSSRGPKEEKSYSDYDVDTVKQLKEFAKLKEESVSKDWKTFADEEDKEYGTKGERYKKMQEQLQSRFPGEDIDALANDTYKGTFDSKNRKVDETEYIKDKQQLAVYKSDLGKFQNEIETDLYAYDDGTGKRVPNFNISAADWARELSESGFLDDISDEEFKIVSDWFKSKTGRNLNDYLN